MENIGKESFRMRQLTINGHVQLLCNILPEAIHDISQKLGHGISDSSPSVCCDPSVSWSDHLGDHWAAGWQPTAWEKEMSNEAKKLDVTIP